MTIGKLLDNVAQRVEDLRPGLRQVVRARLRLKHYGIRAEKSYVDWIKRSIYFHGKRHPGDMGRREIEAFVSFSCNRIN